MVEWVELCVQVMEEANEETKGIVKTEKREERKKRFRCFNTRSTTNRCVVETCNKDYSPWVCKAFSDLPVSKRRELIAKQDVVIVVLPLAIEAKTVQERECVA